jgi:transcriptional regulator with XRE-family HTH domain
MNRLALTFLFRHQERAMSETMHDKITRLMRERGYTARALSLAAGLNPSAVWQILSSEGGARLGSLEAIARALGVDVGYLVSDMVDMSREEADLVRTLRGLSPEQRALVRGMAAQLQASQRTSQQPTD